MRSGSLQNFHVARDNSEEEQWKTFSRKIRGLSGRRNMRVKKTYSKPDTNNPHGGSMGRSCWGFES